MTELKFVRCMKRLTSFYFKEISPDDLSAWYELFRDISEEVLKNAITSIVKESKYMPNINLLLEKCNTVKNNYYLKIVERMYSDGYFKRGVKELDPEHESRNYEKTIRWIEKGIIPGFLKEDMKEYMYDDELVIENKSSFLIE